MRYQEAQGFMDLAARAEKGIKQGEDIRDPELWRRLEQPQPKPPRIIYRCEKKEEGCGKRETLWAGKAPHVYTWAPHKYDVHKGRPNRGDLRKDLLALRSASESLNNAVKYDFLGNAGAAKPRCIQTEQQMQWYVWGRHLARLLRQLVLLDGTFERYAAEVSALGLDRPGLVDFALRTEVELD